MEEVVRTDQSPDYFARTRLIDTTLGLGLFISRKLCQLHGGDIGVASKYGIGSTFGFFFRVKRSHRPEGTGSDDDSDVESLADTAFNDVAARERASSLQSDSHNQEFDQPHQKGVKPPKKVDNKNMPQSLINPPTEFREEAHPGISTDERHNVTEKVAERVRSSDRESSPDSERKPASKRDQTVTKSNSPKKPDPESGGTARPSAAAAKLPANPNGKNVL